MGQINWGAFFDVAKTKIKGEVLKKKKLQTPDFLCNSNQLPLQW